MKENKAITLVALVITIIILLILAGISIAQLSGNGLFTRSKLAKQKYEYFAAKEILNLKLVDIHSECLTNGQEYTLELIANKLKLSTEDAIEIIYYYGTNARQKTGIETYANIDGIVVIAKQYSQYKFLLGEETNKVGIIGVSNTTSNTLAKTDFESVEEFETKVIGKVIDSYDNLSTTINSFEQMLEACNIEGDYTVDDIIDNKDNTLKTILNNKKAVEYIINNPETFLNKVVNSQNAIAELAQNQNSRISILHNSTWLEGINESSFSNDFDSGFSVIQHMSSNSGPGGTTSAVSTQNGIQPFYAFDGDISTNWVETESSNSENELIYTFDDMKSIYKMQIDLSNVTNTSNSNSLNVYISNNDNSNNWELVFSDSWDWGNNVASARHDVSFLLDELKDVKRIKIKSTLICRGWYWTQGIKEVRAYGI